MARRENPKRVGPGQRSAPAPSRGLSDRRHISNQQVQAQAPGFEIESPLFISRNRRIGVRLGPGLRITADGTLTVDMDWVRANL